MGDPAVLELARACANPFATLGDAVSAVLGALNAHLPAGRVMFAELNHDSHEYRVLDARGEVLRVLDAGVRLPLRDSFCLYMANDEAPALVGHASEDPLYAELPLHTSYGVQSYVGAPVELGNGSRVGSVCAMSTQPDSYGERDLALLTIGARIIAYEWEHVTREVELRRLARRQRPRTEDPLTGLPLRDAFLDQLDREWHLTQRGITQSYLLAVTLVGLDGARAASGDALADLLLQSTGEVIVAERRRTDIAGRISDHAFGVILVGCRDAEGASAFRTRLERAFARKLSQRPEQLELTWSTQLLGDADSAAGALANVEQGLGAEPAGSVPV